MFRERSAIILSLSQKAKLDNKKAEHIAPLKKLWPYIRPHKFRLFFALLALTVASLTLLMIGHGIQLIVDHGLEKGDIAYLDQGLFALGFVVFILAGASYTRLYLLTWLGEKTIARLRADVFRHLLKLDIEWYEHHNTGEIISRLTNDTTLLQSTVGTSLPIALRNIILLTGGIMMMLTTNASLTLIVGLAIPFILVPILFLAPRVRARSKVAQEKIGFIGATLDESLHAIRDIKAFTKELFTDQTMQKRTDVAFESALKYVRLRAALSSIIILVVLTAVGLILWYGGHQVIGKTVTGGELSAFVFFTFITAGSVGALSDIYGELLRAAGAAERLFDLMTIKPKIHSHESAKPVVSDAVKGNLTFRDISFHYPSNPDIATIQDISLNIKEGEHIAIVGPSGAGKSTLFKLLLRLYDTAKGHILIDGLNIRDLDIASYRSLFGLVPQDPIIFSGSAFENILFGHPFLHKDSSEALEYVIKAAQAAYADEFIKALPEGYETTLGERGVRLSGGQAQRIAMARALIRDPKILLLDEATSHLDTASEKKVQSALDEMMKRRTTLVIAHRLSTVENADRIIVLDQGKIVGTGTHNELLKSSPLYKELSAKKLIAAA